MTKSMLHVFNDDVLFSWAHDGLVAYIGAHLRKTELTDGTPEISFERAIRLELSNPPTSRVVQILVNSVNSHVVVLTERADDTVVVPLPKFIWKLHQSSAVDATDNEDNIMCRARHLELPSMGVAPEGVVDASWHPELFYCLILLLDKETFCVYDVRNSGLSPVSVIATSTTGGISQSSGRFAATLDEFPVSFDIGPAIYGPHRAGTSVLDDDSADATVLEPRGVSPLYVLHGNGDVYVVVLDLVSRNKYPVYGPLRMTPPAQDNYGMDAVTIRVINRAAAQLHNEDECGLPTVLAIGTSSGMIYHCVVVDAEDDCEDVRFPFGLDNLPPILCVYECVELLSEYGGDTVDARPESTTLCIYSGSSTADTFTYYITTGFDVYSVTIEWLLDLMRRAQFDQTDRSGQEKQSNVDHLVALTGEYSESKSGSLVSGILLLPTTVSEIGPHQLSSSHVTVALSIDDYLHVKLSDETGPSGSHAVSKCRMGTGQIDANVAESERKDSFLDHIRAILFRRERLPVLKSVSGAQASEMSSKELHSVVVDATSILHDEYITKLQTAKSVCDKKVSQLQRSRGLQYEKLEKLRSQRLEARNKISSLNEAATTLANRQCCINDRLDALLKNLRSRSGIMSDAELQMHSQQVAVSTRLAKLQTRFDGLKSKIDAQEDVNDNTPMSPSTQREREISSHQLSRIQQLLQDQNQQIEQAVQVLNAVGGSGQADRSFG